MSDKHIHKYTKIIALKDEGSTNGWDGSSRDVRRVILARQCSCEHYVAFECGDAESMRELYRSIKE